MASQSRKHRGYATQRIVAEYLQANGWEHALPVGAGRYVLNLAYFKSKKHFQYVKMHIFCRSSSLVTVS